jgi:hypothetical protein
MLIGSYEAFSTSTGDCIVLLECGRISSRGCAMCFSLRA